MSLNLRYCSLSNKKLNLCTVSEWACAYCAKSGDGDARGHWGGGENLYAMTKMMLMVAGEGCKETFRRNGDRDKQPVGPRLSIEVTITSIISSLVFVFRSVFLSVCLCVSVCEAFIITISLLSWVLLWVLGSLNPFLQPAANLKISVKRIFQGWFLRDRGHHWPRKLRCCQACKAQNHKDWGQFSHFICDD